MSRGDDREPTVSGQESHAAGVREREPGRLRGAWSVLLGERLVPVQIHAEWREYQQIFDDLLKRLSTQLARQAKAEKRRVRRLLEEAEPGSESSSRSDVQPPAGSKAELRSRAAAARGLSQLQLAINRGAPPPPPSNGSKGEAT